MKIIKNNY